MNVISYTANWDFSNEGFPLPPAKWLLKKMNCIIFWQHQIFQFFAKKENPFAFHESLICYWSDESQNVCFTKNGALYKQISPLITCLYVFNKNGNAHFVEKTEKDKKRGGGLFGTLKNAKNSEILDSWTSFPLLKQVQLPMQSVRVSWVNQVLPCAELSTNIQGISRRCTLVVTQWICSWEVLSQDRPCLFKQTL